MDMILDLFDINKLRTQIGSLTNELFELLHFKQLNSTNQFLIDNRRLASGSICLADVQSNGRGQFGRFWASSSTANLYASILMHYQKMSDITSIPFRAALSVAKVLKSFGFPILLKWPNDVLLDGKKLAGILVESIVSDKIYVVVGIGLNISLDMEDYRAIDQPCIDLVSYNNMHAAQFSRTTIIAHILSGLLNDMADTNIDPTALMLDWMKYDYYFNKPVAWRDGVVQYGTGLGLDISGAYRVKTDTAIVLVKHADKKLTLV